jgi:Skp family chaperone for outer membrane proteins
LKTHIKTIISALASLIVIVLLLLIYLQGNNKDKIYYVETATLYNEFDLKKELEKEYDQIIGFREKQKDSLESLKAAIYEELKNSSKYSDQEKEAIWQQQSARIDKEKNEILETNVSLTREYEEKIWKQLNAYVKDYRKKHNIDFLFGAMGDGHILSASEKKNMTDDLIIYVNKQFNGD